MKKIKYLLIFILSIFCLNSCLTTAMILTSYCYDGHSCPSWLISYEEKEKKPSQKSPVGKLHQETSIEEDKNYYNSILSRPKEYVELEDVKILLPKDMTFKKLKKVQWNDDFGLSTSKVGYYLYDNKKNIGFPLGITKKEHKDFVKSEITGKFNKDDRYIKEISNNVYQKTNIFNDIGSSKSRIKKDTSYVKNIKNSDFYVTYKISEEGKKSSEKESIMKEFFSELVKDW